MLKLLRVSSIVVLAFFALLVSLPLFIHADDFRPVIEGRLSAATGRAVHLGKLRLALFSGGIEADDLSIADDPAFGSTPFIRAKALRVGVALGALIFSRRVEVTALRINRPDVVLLRNRNGKWNFSSLGSKASKATGPAATGPAVQQTPGYALSARLLEIEDGHVSLKGIAANAKPRALDRVNAEIRNFSPGSEFPFALTATVVGGGVLHLTGKAGPIDSSDMAKTPGECKLTLKNLDLVGSQTVEASSGIGGFVSVDGDAKSNGHVVTVEGKLVAEQLRLAHGAKPAQRPVEVEYRVEHAAEKMSGRIERGDVHIGKAALKILGTYDIASPEPVIHLRVTGPSMPLPELVAMLPALDIALPSGSSIEGGNAHANVNTDGPLNGLVTAGTVGADNFRLNGFNLGSRLSVVERLAGIKGGSNTDIKTLRANFRNAGEVTSISGIDVVAGNIGDVTGEGTVSSGHVLNFQMHADIQTSGALMAALGQRNGTAVPFTIEGTAENPVFKPDLKSLAAGKLKALTRADEVKKVGNALKGLLGGRK